MRRSNKQKTAKLRIKAQKSLIKHNGHTFKPYNDYGDFKACISGKHNLSGIFNRMGEPLTPIVNTGTWFIRRDINNQYTGVLITESSKILASVKLG